MDETITTPIEAVVDTPVADLPVVPDEQQPVAEDAALTTANETNTPVDINFESLPDEVVYPDGNITTDGFGTYHE